MKIFSEQVNSSNANNREEVQEIMRISLLKHNESFFLNEQQEKIITKFDIHQN